MAKKLVIIDDNSTQLIILKTLFTNNGWEVCGVQNAKIGYEIIFDFAPDLIITDAIMPLIGGFQLVKQIRKNPIISKIPVIVYSILSENNAKFYIKEEHSEYFLKKDNNHDELLKLASTIIEKFPLEKDYKDAILRASIQNYSLSKKETEKEILIENTQKEYLQNPEEINKEKFNPEKLINEIKNISDFSFSDEKIFVKLFSLLYEILKYNLATITVYSFEQQERKSFFDIKDIILSPILKNTILNRHQSKIAVLYKKYAPHLNTIVNESEFLSTLEFNFGYKNEKIANIVFYSNEKLKWENIEYKEILNENLYNFFKTRYIQRNSQAHKKEDKTSKYHQLFNKFSNIKNSKNAYFSIIQISNYLELTQNLISEDIDILNSRISEKIIECLEKDEQIYKNDEDEYNIVIFAKDKKHAKNRLEYIAKEINEISYNTYHVNTFISVAKCDIGGNFNIIEAQKNARKIIEDSNQQESVTIYDE